MAIWLGPRSRKPGQSTPPTLRRQAPPEATVTRSAASWVARHPGSNRMVMARNVPSRVVVVVSAVGAATVCVVAIPRPPPGWPASPPQPARALAAANASRTWARERRTDTFLPPAPQPAAPAIPPVRAVLRVEFPRGRNRMVASTAGRHGGLGGRDMEARPIAVAWRPVDGPAA